jgi:hypothetical protein
LSLHARIGLRSKDSRRKRDSERSHDGNLYLQSMVSLAERSGDVARTESGPYLRTGSIEMIVHFDFTLRTLSEISYDFHEARSGL